MYVIITATQKYSKFEFELKSDCTILIH